MRVAVYAISLNEERNIEAWAESARDANVLLIADTGSTDGTVALARAAGVQVVEVRVIPWRFDVARNASLAALPDDIDWCVALDLDERLLPGWREALEAVPDETTRAPFWYTWSWKADGSPNIQHWRDFCHRRAGYFWKGAVHEGLVAYGFDPEVITRLRGAQAVHRQDLTKPRRTQYLDLLALSVREDPLADRHAFWYARELLYANRKDEAAAEFRRHIDLPTAKWQPERAASMHFLSLCEPEHALYWLQRSEQTAPDRREPKVRLAKYYYGLKDWPETLRWADEALAITDRPEDYLTEDFVWGSLPHVHRYMALHHLGRAQGAVESAEQAAALDPDNETIQSDLALLRKRLEREEAPPPE